MASLIESVRKLHGPTLAEHNNGYDVDVICPECTRLRTEALERASTDGEGWVYGAELPHVPYPCPTRVTAGTTTDEGKNESARMRLDHLVVQREKLEERMERLDAVIGLIRRDLGELTNADADVDLGDDERLDQGTSTPSTGAGPNLDLDEDPSNYAIADLPDLGAKRADDYDF